jgi:hypothetical protein
MLRREAPPARNVSVAPVLADAGKRQPDSGHSRIEGQDNPRARSDERLSVHRTFDHGAGEANPLAFHIDGEKIVRERVEDRHGLEERQLPVRLAHACFPQLDARGLSQSFYAAEKDASLSLIAGELSRTSFRFVLNLLAFFRFLPCVHKPSHCDLNRVELTAHVSPRSEVQRGQCVRQVQASAVFSSRTPENNSSNRIGRARFSGLSGSPSRTGDQSQSLSHLRARRAHNSASGAEAAVGLRVASVGGALS